jgi:CheY-like chemotaxis protein
MRTKILLVDDQNDILTTFAALLNLRGYDTRTAQTGSEALAIAAEYLPDVVCLDLALPGMNGYELSRQLRHGADNAKTWIVAFSGYPPDPTEMKEAGINRHLRKPGTVDNFIELLTELSVAN